MEPITFEKLPEAVNQLLTKVDNIERLLSDKTREPAPDPDRWFDLSEFCEYHPDRPARATVYQWVSERRVPFHKNGKKLRFLKSEIDAWLKENKKSILQESVNEVDRYLIKKR
jgi:excisionase family DNA binding protein